MIENIEDVLILVGRNNAGKSIVLDAIRALTGDFPLNLTNFHSDKGNISIQVQLLLTESDLRFLHERGIVSDFKHYEKWKQEFIRKLPSYNPLSQILSFEFIYTRNGTIKYRDGGKKHNPFIPMVLPRIYFIDHLRRNIDIKENLILLGQDFNLKQLQENLCIFDNARRCNQCFECIGIIHKKKPEELTLLETSRLLQYKLFHVKLNEFADKLNQIFHRNGAISEKIKYEIHFDVNEVFKIDTTVIDQERGIEQSIEHLGEGFRSLYILSFLETYISTENISPYIIMIEEPEMFLHPQLQKIASQMLYKLSFKNQVIFSTHEPEMLFNFTTKQIRQVYLNQNFATCVRKNANIDAILDDLGFTANDFLNVSFVFIVEGKQDRSRLPLLLQKYYSEIMTDNGELKRIAIISTNSCTNIKTYANLKYINSLYLKDQFMMIRDSDGKDRLILENQLCNYYEKRRTDELGNLPRVTKKNVLILKYYSFENYFLFPEIMEKIGVIQSQDEFFDILWQKYQEYLYRLSSVKYMLAIKKFAINNRQDLIEHIEDIRIYVRGHNLYDIFYGRYKKNETEILKLYIDAAPKEIFDDILEKIDHFVYFHCRKK